MTMAPTPQRWTITPDIKYWEVPVTRRNPSGRRPIKTSYRLEWVDLYTGKVESKKFGSMDDARAWAAQNVRTLPDGVRIERPGGDSVRLVGQPAPRNGVFDPNNPQFQTREFGNRGDFERHLSANRDRFTYTPQPAGPPAPTRQTTPAAPAAAPTQTRPVPPTSPNMRMRMGGDGPQVTSAAPAPASFDSGFYGGGGGGGGGGVGGVGAPPASNIPDPATMNDAELDAYIRQTYGYMAWALDHPEIGPILRQSAREGWDANRLQGAVSATAWWRTTSEVSRSWTVLESTDPATAEAQIVARTNEIAQASLRMGAQVSATRARQISRDSLRFGWDPATLNATLVNEIKYRPGTADTPQGQLAANMQQAKVIAAQFMTPLSDASALDYARRMLLGQLGPDILAATFAQQARARFPTLGNLIDQGVTPGDYFAPYKEMVAAELEIDPNQVDLINDSRWSKIIEYDPGTNGKVLRPMTLSETRALVRKQPEWDTTKRANEMAAQFAEQLAQTFGVIA